AAGYDTGPAPNQSDAAAAGAHPHPGPMAFQQLAEIRDCRRRHEVCAEASPILPVILADRINQLALGVVGWGLGDVKTKESTTPPADFIVGEIADPFARASIYAGRVV